MARIRFRIVLAATLTLGTSSLFAACDPTPNPAPTFTSIRGIDKFAARGPERVATQRVGACTLFVPPISEPGSRVGLGFAGELGSLPTLYAGILDRVASFGTLVTAANSTSSGTGNEIASCIEELHRQRSDSSGRFVAAGHSVGGSFAISASARSQRVAVTCVVQLDGITSPTSTGRQLKGSRRAPALILCGGADRVAPCTQQGNGDTKFLEALVPITRINVIGADHMEPTNLGASGNGGLYAALLTSCAEALDGDPLAQMALSPGGAEGARGLDRIASRNFDAVGLPF